MNYKAIFVSIIFVLGVGFSLPYIILSAYAEEPDIMIDDGSYSTGTAAAVDDDAVTYNDPAVLVAPQSDEIITVDPETDITPTPTPAPGEIVVPGGDDGDLASDNRVTIGGLDFGGFTINLGELSGNRIIEVTSSIAVPVAEGLKASLENVFGPYTPRMETVTYYGADGVNYSTTRQVQGIAGVDIEWIATVILYGICLYCFFRILGMVINRC